MIHRVNKCFGVPIWKWGKTYVELWVAFSGVPPHIHPDQESEIVPLFGWSRFFKIVPPTKPFKRETIRVRITPKRWFRGFTVQANWVHWFETRFLVFLNISTRSAAANLQYV